MRRTVEWIWLSILILLPIVLWILPAGIFDADKFVICPSRRFLNFECPACGMTRAFMHFHNFNFLEGIYYNWLVVLFYPALGVIWLIWLKASLLFLNLPGAKYIPFKTNYERKLAKEADKSQDEV